MSDLDAPQGEPRLSARALAAYAAPQLALSALYFPVFVYLTPFYAAERGLPLAALGAILIGVRLLDAVTDPLMGALSDRWRTRFGRRKPWLAVSTPLVCVSVWMAMAPPPGVGLGYVAFWLAALTLSWTVALTPYQAWGGELSVEYHGRARAAAWRESAFLLGALGAAALYASGGGGGEGLRRIALAVALSLPALALLALLGAPEPRDRSRLESGRTEWRALLAIGPLRALLAAHFLNSAANALPAALFLFFVGAVLEADQGAAAVLLAIYFLCAVATTPFWLWAARRSSKHRVWAGAMLAACVVFAAASFLGAGDVGAFAAICVLTGFAFGADIALPPSIQADVVDIDTAANGAQRTGLFFALWSVTTKLSSALAAGAGLWILDGLGFDPQAAATPADVALALALLYAGAPVVLKLAAAALIWRFDLGPEAQAELRRRIEASAAR